MSKRLWTRDELVLAFNLYCKLTFGKMHSSNPQVIQLANLIDRTPSSVAYKLVNLASFDPALQARGIKGAENASKLDKMIWEEFYNNSEELVFESELLLAEKQQQPIEKVANIITEDLPREGKERMRVVKVRVNQSVFRSGILAVYNSTCCITGLTQPELLVASHIRPWAIDEENRLNRKNGICINALHDKAFESGLLTITPDYRIKISSLLKKTPTEPVKNQFLRYENQEIILPIDFVPDKNFLTYHNNERFKP